MDKDKINRMNQDIKELKKEVKEMHETLRRVEEACSRMNRHVSFVETTYTNIREPMDFVLAKVSRYMGISEAKYSLPAIETDKKDED